MGRSRRQGGLLRDQDQLLFCVRGGTRSWWPGQDQGKPARQRLGEAELMEPQLCGRQGKREEGHGRVRRHLSRGSEWRRYL